MARGLEQLIRELHRRSMWQVAGIFVAASWVVLQVVDLFVDRGLVPEWTFTGAFLLLLLGLPVVLATAFLQGDAGRRGPAATPDGVPNHDPESAPPGRDISGSRADPVAGSVGAGVARLLTWRRALLGGAGAFVLLAVGVGGWLVMRSTGIGPPAPWSRGACSRSAIPSSSRTSRTARAIRISP